MHDFTELKNQLCKELDKISAKGELNTQSLDYADKAAHALKCILTVEAMMEEYPSYSGTMVPIVCPECLIMGTAIAIAAT